MSQLKNTTMRNKHQPKPDRLYEVKGSTRAISRHTENELWARAAGRCELAGCNKLLFKSPLTHESVNIAQKAHIWSFSSDGPRGSGPYAKKRSQINEHDNLLLACADCHKLIDSDKKGRFTAKLLQHSKQEHERRIAINTGVDPEKKSHVLIYAANIDNQPASIRLDDAHNAMFPDWYPANERPVLLSMSWKDHDSNPNYWQTEADNLKMEFASQVQPLITEDKGLHFSVFAFAPIPLLTQLGALLTDKLKVQTYQLHREPKATWHWMDNITTDIKFKLKPPRKTSHLPVLVLALSDYICHSRITSILGSNVSIWNLTIAEPDNDFLQSQFQLSAFRRALRSAMVHIGRAHDHTTPLSIFPAIPVACAVELGRIRMPKAQMPWVIYDQSNVHGKFIKTLTIK